MKFIRTALPYLAASLIASFSLAFSAPALAQYMWLDAAGRKVFSDQPPPANVPAKRILQQPGKAPASMQTSSADEKASAETDADSTKTAAKPKSSAATQPNTSKDKDLEAAKKKIDDEAAAKKKADQEKMDEAKADNCKRAKQAKSTFDSGMRLNHTNSKGERGIMDEATRMVETKRVEGIIATDCK